MCNKSSRMSTINDEYYRVQEETKIVKKKLKELKETNVDLDKCVRSLVALN